MPPPVDPADAPIKISRKVTTETVVGHTSGEVVKKPQVDNVDATWNNENDKALLTLLPETINATAHNATATKKKSR